MKIKRIIVSLSIAMAVAAIGPEASGSSFEKFDLKGAMNNLGASMIEATNKATTAFKGKKTVEIKLTGTLYEPMRLTIGNTGREELITDLPYSLIVAKEELPLKLQFESDRYLYYDIDVPKKPFDSTGHIYLVKINETAMALNGSSKSTSSKIKAQRQETTVKQKTEPENVKTPEAQTKAKDKEGTKLPVKTIDVSQSINVAPKTGIKNEKTFALIISNEEYDMAANVDNATNDGLAFKEYCVKTLGIPDDNVRHFSNLSFGRMRKAFTDMLDLAELLQGEANLIIYYAGHGIPDNKTKDAFLMPVDADGTDTEVCISLTGLYDKINSKDLNRCVVFIDACFSGAQRGGDMIVAARGVKLKPTEAVPSGKTIVFSATSDDEAAYSHKTEKHGLFTYFLLSKLKETKGKVTLGELAEHLHTKVAFESRRINNIAQTPKVSVAPGIADSWKSIRLTK